MQEKSVIQTVPISVSVVMISRNEANNIAACCESLKDFSEIILVDNGSTDETVKIAQSYSNVRVLLSEWKGYGGTRQIGVNAACHDWILWMDADERMTSDLQSEILSALAAASSQTVFSIPRQNYFLGRRIYGCGWSPDRVTRVFNRTQTQFDDKIVHEGLVSKSQRRDVSLNNRLTHYTYVSLQQFFEKNLRYALLAAEERVRLERKVYFAGLLVRPLWEFFRSYVLKLGFLDGVHGIVISGGSAIYVFCRDSQCLLQGRRLKN